MEEINLKDFWQFYKKYTLGIIIVCLLFLIVALVYNIAFKTPMYSTSTTLLLVKNETTTEKDDTINQNDITLNQGENPDDVSLCGNNANDITINDNAIDYDNENINKLDMSFLPGDVIPSFNHRENKKLLEDVSFM